ncbi:MAG: sn-glycerol-3-phosphate ABC transporter ATP-binding protein UgpC [Clostridia bacterium]|nr:sn-glycerol-3-phosphate ABC transporter ATP-binding protein UgpC [Clostridia bacterium]
MAGLKLNHVCKIYDGKVKAVSDVCINIKDKEFVVLVGPSGCGKSTTLRMIAGLEDISSGDIFIGDRRVNLLESKDRNIAMVFQNYALFPNMSVADNISFGLRMQGVDKEIIKEKVESIASMLGLSDYLKAKPANLSGGQRQRVALGRAIVREPDVFLLDEPLSNLDAKLRAKMRAELSALHRKLGTTFIYVTHDQVEAMTMGDRIVVMKDGVVMQSGSPRQLFNHPANKFTAGFIGTPQMNFFDCTVTRDEDGAIVDAGFIKFALSKQQLAKLKVGVGENKNAILGIRPEHIAVGEEQEGFAKILTELVSVEDLGPKSLVHLLSRGGEREIEFAGYGSSDVYYNDGELFAYVNTDLINLFDSETEDTLLPEIPEYVEIGANIKNGVLTALNGSVKLPSALNTLKDGDITMRVPAEAIVQGNDFSGVVESRENVEDGKLCFVNSKGTVFFAIGDYPDKCTFSLDFSKVTFVTGEEVVDSIPAQSLVDFKYERLKEDCDGKKIKKHYAVFGDTRVETFYDFNTKMYRLGKKIFENQFKLGVKLNTVRLARENEVYPTISATLEGNCDFEGKKFMKLRIADSTFFVEGEGDAQTQLVALDFDNMPVYDGEGNLLFD